MKEKNMDNIKYANLRKVKMVKLILVEVNEGKGTENDSTRRVRCYFDLEGNLLWHNDNQERLYRGASD